MHDLVVAELEDVDGLLSRDGGLDVDDSERGVLSILVAYAIAVGIALPDVAIALDCAVAVARVVPLHDLRVLLRGDARATRS